MHMCPSMQPRKLSKNVRLIIDMYSSSRNTGSFLQKEKIKRYSTVVIQSDQTTRNKRHPIK